MAFVEEDFDDLLFWERRVRVRFSYRNVRFAKWFWVEDDRDFGYRDSLGIWRVAFDVQFWR